MARPLNNYFKIEMLLLKIISEGDCYGYQICQIIEQLSDGRITLLEGSIYPVLYRLVDGDISAETKFLSEKG